MSYRSAYILLVVLLFAACAKEEANPFADLDHSSPNPSVESIPQDNFAWLHQRIFRPTCAASGCHDGTFEPEFRTISSAYNSLVLHPVIANDPANSFEFRVVPGDANASFLHERLTAFVENTSGMMPLAIVEGSDWPANDDAYIAAITHWIQTGAKDMFGQPPSAGNLEPQVSGLLAFPQGNTTQAYPRGDDAGVQPIEVPAGQVDLWFAFSDESTPSTELTVNQYKLATSGASFPMIPGAPLVTGVQINGPDFGNSTTTFTHRAALDLSTYAPGTLLFVRAYVNDGDHTDPTEIPNDGTESPMLDYFTLLITS